MKYLAKDYILDYLQFIKVVLRYEALCRLHKEKRVEPFFGEDSVKCFYTCTDKDNIVITTHSDHVCEKQIQTPRGDQRDWRNRLKY